jgi:hypothetical protein
MKFAYEHYEGELEGLLAQDPFEYWEVFGAGHYRINGVLDIWPRRSKYMYQPTAEHGQYQELSSFLGLIFDS